MPDNRFGVTAIEREPGIFVIHFTFQNIDKTFHMFRASKMLVVGIKRIRIRFGVKGALSRIFSISLKRQNMHLCHGKQKNNGPFLLTIAILVR